MERRCFIGLAFGVTVCIPLPGVWSRPVRADTLFETIFGDASEAARLGASHAALDPAAGDRGRRLVNDLAVGAGRNQNALRALLGRRIVDELADLDTVVVDGWVMARSEADLCAAVYSDGAGA